MYQTSASLKVAMTPFPYAIAIDATLAEAGQLMTEHDVHHLPVTDEATRHSTRAGDLFGKPDPWRGKAQFDALERVIAARDPSYLT